MSGAAVELHSEIFMWFNKEEFEDFAKAKPQNSNFIKNAQPRNSIDAQRKSFGFSIDFV